MIHSEARDSIRILQRLPINTHSTYPFDDINIHLNQAYIHEKKITWAYAA